MLLLTGVRPNDLLNFRVEDFNFDSNVLNIRISKTNREIKFPIYDELLYFIEKNMKEEFGGDKTELIFKPFTVIAISKRFIRIKKS
jgi:integrase